MYGERCGIHINMTIRFRDGNPRESDHTLLGYEIPLVDYIDLDREKHFRVSQVIN